MPQMAPINWLSLYLMFITIFIIFIIKNYYLFTYKQKLTKIINKPYFVSWKW